jgi:hypothetical protein
MLQNSTYADTDSAPEPLPLATCDSKCVGAAKTRPEYHGQKKRKRCSDQEDDTGEIDEDRFSEMARSERKRYREKKRRNDVNKGCNDLLSILIEVDPLLRAEAEERAQRDQWKGTDRAHDDNLLSRVDLISRTVGVLRRVHQENECRKQIIEQLLKSNGGVSGMLVSILLPLPIRFLTATVVKLTEALQAAAMPERVGYYIPLTPCFVYPLDWKRFAHCGISPSVKESAYGCGYR